MFKNIGSLLALVAAFEVWADFEAWEPIADNQASGLPVIRIDTKDKAKILDRVNYVNMTFTLTDSNNPQYDVVIENIVNGIKGRGNTTWFYPKKPYRIKFDSKHSLFGLPSSKSWVLLAEYRDPTLIMNKTAFELGEIFNLPYNHTYHHVQLYLNDEYRGIYGLTEQNNVGKGRIDIDKNKGWLVEMSVEYNKDPKFKTTNYNLPVMIKSPEFEQVNMSNPAYDFVVKDINELCDSLASVNFPENGYRDLIDMNTFIDFLMINEIVKNNEIWWPKSTYLYKNKDGKISMGPLWDFDWAYSYADTGFTYFTKYNERSGRHSFFNRFFEDPIFLVKYKERWNENYNKIVAVSEFIENAGTELAAFVEENFNMWNASNNYAQQITSMKNWWNDRCAWLNTGLNGVEVLPASKNFEVVIYNYSEISPQTFTLAAYDDMTDLSAMLQKKESSVFEISTELSETISTGNGGYLATISVKPKISLLAAAYTDTLVLSGTNQNEQFKVEIPLSFVVNNPPQPPSNISILSPQIAVSNQAIQIFNGISLTIANNAALEIFDTKGNLISRQSFAGGVHTISLGHLPKGMYIVKVSFGNGKQILRIPVM